MKITNEMIHPDLRKAGLAIRRVLPFFTEKIFRLTSVLLRGIKGRRRRKLYFEEKYLERADGSFLRICVYGPLSRKEAVPGLLWIHGGGYAMGTPEMDEALIHHFVKASQCVVVAPDYTLSTKAPYPAALEDCYMALLWLRSHGEFYGMREDQIMVGGESAGGGLAAAVCLLARDRGGVKIAFQMPLYPMLDDRMESESCKDNDGPLWNCKSNETGWKLYLGKLYGSGDVPAYAAPARAKDLRGLPPACSFVGSIDPFHDETATYMHKLEESGVPVHFRSFEGCFHGFEMACPKAGVATSAQEYLLGIFEFAVRNYFAAQPE